MHAIILAAGLGSRLQSGLPKPLTPVAGVALLDRTIAGMLEAGAERVHVVVGHEGERIEAHVAASWAHAPVGCLPNPEFRLGNGLSVLAARAAVDGPFVLSMADHVVSGRVWRLAFEAKPPPDGAILLVDRDIDRVFDLEDATKVRCESDRVIAIGKEIPVYDCIDVGVFVATRGLFAALSAVRDSRGDASLSDGIQALAARGSMRILDIAGAFWQDVDTPEMLAHTEALLAGMQ